MLRAVLDMELVLSALGVVARVLLVEVLWAFCYFVVVVPLATVVGLRDAETSAGHQAAVVTRVVLAVALVGGAVGHLLAP